MGRLLTVALDAMGGDFGPTVVIPAAIQALKMYSQLNLLIVGRRDVILSALLQINSNILSRITIISAESIIDGNIKPAHAIRASRGTSMRIMLELIRDGCAQACVSAGNTGALMGLAKLVVKPLQGITRPALTVFLPNKKKRKTVILDLGANIECDSLMLTQFAVIGSILAEQILGIEHPKVALLNIGAESIKGLDNIRQASEILNNTSLVNYIGYLEANELLMGHTDVLVCDGFIGNIALKTMEGVIKVFLSLLSQSYYTGKFAWLVKLIKIWIKKRLIIHFGQLHPDQYNGAYLVGLKGTVIKSHGAANQRAFITAIEQAMQSVIYKIPEKIAARLDTALLKK